MTVDVSARTVEPTPTAVVAAATTWATLPGGLVATATHTGPIGKIGDTHQAVCDWSQANGYRLAGPHWEIYGDPDPSGGDFDVQVFWSLVAPSAG
jgi:GyrI-like small molecule binding domain